MTIENIPPVQEMLCDGASVVFPVPFVFLDPTDLIVTLILVATEARTVLTYGTDYTVTGGGNPTPATGNIVTTAAYPATYDIEVTRVTPQNQEMNLVDFDDFSAVVVDGAVDKLTLIAQELSLRIAAIEATGVGGIVSAVNIGGSGAGVFAGQLGNLLQFKKLVGGPNVTISDDGSTLTLLVTAPGIATPGDKLRFYRADGTFSSRLGGVGVPFTYGASDFDSAFSLYFDSGPQPSLMGMHYGAAPADQKNWYWRMNSNGTLILTMADDAGNQGGDVFTFNRVGTYVNQIIFGQPGTVIQLSGAIYDGVSAINISGTLGFDQQAQGGLLGDMDNPTLALRFKVQSNVVNSTTLPMFLPNGAGLASGVLLLNKSDTLNNTSALLFIGATAAVLNVAAVGTGTVLPLDFRMAGTTIVRITPSGDVGIGTTSPSNTGGTRTLDLQGPSGGEARMRLVRSNTGYGGELYSSAGGLAITTNTSSTIVMAPNGGAGSITQFFPSGRISLSNNSDDGVNKLQVVGHVNIDTASKYKVNNVQVVGGRDTGWSTPLGSASKSALPAVPTLAQVGSYLAALHAALATTHGLIGT